MDIEIFRDYCLSLKSVTESTPFDEETLVFKVSGKMFALANIDNFDRFSVKCDPDVAIELRQNYHSVKSGYHLNKKHWNTIEIIHNELSDEQLKYWIKHSYDLVLAKIPEKIKKLENFL